MTIRPNLAPVFRSLRHILLALSCLAFLAGFYRHPQPWSLAIAALLGAGVVLVQFRYLRLAVLVALVPLPGLVWFAPSYYPFAFALAALMASGLAIRLLKGSPADEAFAHLFDPVPGTIGALVVALGWSLWGNSQIAGMAAASVSVLLVLPVAAVFLPFGEKFHIAANRACEAREPAALAAAHLAEPRWAFSLCGITLVFLVLALFRQPVWPPPWDWIGCALAALVLQVATLDWRSAGAGLISACLLLLYGQGMTEAMPLFVLLALFVAGRPVRGDPVAAYALALEERVLPVFFAGLGAALAAAMLGGLREGLMTLAALAAALIAFPAMTIAQHHLFPRRRSVEELYG